MTARRDTDRMIATWLVETSPEGHVDYLDQTLEALAAVRQRPAWTTPGRWVPSRLAGYGVALRPAPFLVILALLLVATLVALAIIGSRPRLPEPFGLASTGLVTFASENDISATMPDGTGRHALVTGDGVQWGLIWSHRGDRFAYWSAPTTDDKASLWVENADGSNQHLVTGRLTTTAADLLPDVSWSPGDDRLVFGTDTGELYIVNANGTNLHRIGQGTHQRGTPVWSPDGSLIAYTGQPLADPYSQTSTWVITPDGLTDMDVIPAQGGYEIANVNPSWSLDSRSLLTHTGGATDSGPPTDIKLARRGDFGIWSYDTIVGGPEWNYLPAWSTSNKQFTFLRHTEDMAQETFVVMVADADGTNVRQLSDRPVGLATPCWSPDDEFVRAAADGTVVLFPLDGSPPIDIPSGDGASAGCYMQRRAP